MLVLILIWGLSKLGERKRDDREREEDGKRGRRQEREKEHETDRKENETTEMHKKRENFPSIE